MNNRQLYRYALLMGRLARYALLGISVVLLIFALVSGSEEAGLIKNSPNTLPWVGLLAVTLIAGKYKTLGGLLIFLVGIGMIYFFNFRGPNFFFVTFVLTLLITFLGFMVMLSGYIEQNKSMKKV